MGIGRNINECLERKEMTVAQLSRETGIAATTIYSIIQRDSDSVAVNTLQKISKALGVEMWNLIGLDRETARQNKDSFEEFSIFYTDDKKYKEHKFQKSVYEQEKKDMVDYYYSSIVPVLKSLGYKSHFFMYNAERSIILEKDGKEWELTYRDAKEAISDSLYFADYFLNKYISKIRKVTKERVEALHNSPTKEVKTYNRLDTEEQQP